MDNRRIIGPEQSTPYLLYAKSKSFQNIARQNGRKSDELRKIYVKTNVVSQAKGSAYMEFGNTKVIVSVFDPREIPNKNEYSLKGELYCEFKFAPFSSTHRRSPQPDAQEKEYSVIFRRALESAVCRQEFPNFQVDIYALVLENDGSALSAAISAAGIAIAQAGVPMYDLLTCVTLGLHGDQIFVDPTLDEELLCTTLSNQNILNYNNLKKNIGSEVSEFDDWQSQMKDTDDVEFIGDVLNEIDQKLSSKRLSSESSETANTIKKIKFGEENMDIDMTPEQKATEENDQLIELISGNLAINKQDKNEKVDQYENIIEHGLLTLSMLQADKQITEFYFTGSMSFVTIKKLTDILVEKNYQIIPLIQSCLLKYIKESLKKDSSVESY